MAQAGTAPPLRIGFVGSGFIAKFHLKSFEAVRHAQITGVYSPTAANRDALAAAANAAELGPCRAHATLESLLSADDVDAIWLLAPNDQRLAVMRALSTAVKAGKSKVRAVACE
jgi:predicted dehydrogenase